MLPAFAGRLQNIVRLDPIKSGEAAIRLSDFYLNEARSDAAREFKPSKTKGNITDPLSKPQIQSLFATLLKQAAAEKAQEGVTPRDFLNALHRDAEQAFATL